MRNRNLSRRDFIAGTAITAATACTCGVGGVMAKEKANWDMKLATSSVMFDRIPIEKACETVARLGLKGIDIWAPFTWGGAKCDHLLDVKKRLGGKGLRELLTKHKLELAAFTLYGHKLADYSGLIGDFGGGVVVRGTGQKYAKGKGLAEQMKGFFDKLKPDIELADQCNARLAIENHGGSLLNSPDSFKAFVESNPNPKRVGIAIAPYHLQGHKTPIEEVIRDSASQCLFVYAWQRGKSFAQLPGVGPADFGPWVRALAEAKYPHYSSIFMHGHPPAEEMEAKVAKSKEYMLKCLADAQK